MKRKLCMTGIVASTSAITIVFSEPFCSRRAARSTLTSLRGYKLVAPGVAMLMIQPVTTTKSKQFQPLNPSCRVKKNFKPNSASILTTNSKVKYAVRNLSSASKARKLDASAAT